MTNLNQEFGEKEEEIKGLKKEVENLRQKASTRVSENVDERNKLQSELDFAKRSLSSVTTH